MILARVLFILSIASPLLATSSTSDEVALEQIPGRYTGHIDCEGVGIQGGEFEFMDQPTQLDVYADGEGRFNVVETLSAFLLNGDDLTIQHRGVLITDPLDLNNQKFTLDICPSSREHVGWGSIGIWKIKQSNDGQVKMRGRLLVGGEDRVFIPGEDFFEKCIYKVKRTDEAPAPYDASLNCNN